MNNRHFLLAWVTLSACGSLKNQESSNTLSFPHSQLRWDSASIPVCWESAASPTERGWVQSRVTAEFARTPIRFTGWGTCSAGFQGIRIGVNDEGPHTKGLGRAIRGTTNGMVLNFTFKNWGQSCQNSRQHCIETIAVHEFGHAIGLAHEQNRNDTDRILCKDNPQGSDGDFLIGAWDPQSVMNYCNPTWANGGNLSDGDILGIRFLYEGLLPFNLQTGTALHETGGNFQLMMGNYDGDQVPDLFAIAKSGTGSRKTEVHVLSGASNYQSFVLQTATTLHEVGENVEMKLTDWDGDGRSDLVAVIKTNTGTASTEVHIMSQKSNYQSFIVQTGSALHVTDSSWEFGFGDWNRDGRPDLFGLKKDGTGTGMTEVHVLNGATNFNQFILQTPTALHKTDRLFDLEVGDWNQDGRPDVIAVAKQRTGSRSTEVHVLDGASTFSRMSFQRGTLLEETDDRFSFAVADMNRAVPGLELVAFKKSGTGTGSTEVHSLRTF